MGNQWMGFAGLTRILFATATLVAHSTSSLSQTVINVQDTFTPSGWMGDGEHGDKYVQFSEVEKIEPHTPPTSIGITYTFGPNKWAGICWQNEADNWGDKPGVNYAKKNITKLSFWAKGGAGSEVVEFRTGGIDNRQKRYRDSYVATTGRVTLGTAWKEFVVDLSKKDLSSVIAGFCWVANKNTNAGATIRFQIDDIKME